MKRLVLRIALTTWRALLESVDDRIHRDGAQVAFFAMLSFVPLALLLVATFGLAFDDADVRARVVKTVFENIPLSAEDDRGRLEAAVSDALRNAGRLGLFSVVLLIAAGSGVMGALRHTINEAWDIHERPPLLRRKALDLAPDHRRHDRARALARGHRHPPRRRAARRRGGRPAHRGAAGPRRRRAPVRLLGRGDPVPLLRAADAPPAPEGRLAGRAGGRAGLALLREGLELYFEHLADFGALYGSLGALMALLLFLYAAAMVLLFGAEFASEWTRLPAQEETSREVRELRGKARGLVRRG